MRALLIGTAACLTVGTFFAAERLVSSNAEARAIEQEVATQAALDAQLKQSTSVFGLQIAELKEAGAAAASQIAALTGTVETLKKERDDMGLRLIAAQDEKKTNLERIAQVEAMHAEMVEKASLQEATLAEKDTELAKLRADTEKLAKHDSALEEQVAVLSDELKARDEMIASLEETIKVAEAAQAEAAEASAAPEAVAAVSEGADISSSTDLVMAKAQIDELAEALTQREAAIAALETRVLEAEAAVEAAGTVQAPSVSQETLDAQAEQIAQIAALDAQVSQLTQLVEEQTGVIANLRLAGTGDTPLSAEELVEVCTQRSEAILAQAQIVFSTGTTSISQESVETLASLRDLVIGCKNDDILIEIGGHTDSLGDKDNNQKLSEKRAQSVKDFLIERGISAESLMVVGYGETDPVATNETPQGRAENRRITFTWQVRAPEVEVEAEAVEVEVNEAETMTADG